MLIIYLIFLILVNILRFIIAGLQFELAGDLRGIVAPLFFFVYTLLLSLAFIFTATAFKKMKESKSLPVRTTFLPYLLLLPVTGQIVAFVFNYITIIEGLYGFIYLSVLVLFDLLLVALCINFLVILSKNEINTLS